MLLTSSHGDALELNVTGYEFPERLRSSEDDWDRNWLIVSGYVDQGSKSWAFCHPCLTTWEARELAAWLRDVAVGIERERICFTEPNLSFELVSGTSEGAHVVVTLSGEAAPPDTPEDIRWGEGHRLLLHMSPDAVLDAVRVWEGAIDTFPPR